ncbi:MAG: hypothetical protein HRU21_07360, partial [Pseudomonadales bacterium]|nr:hypothetical protein [Pseudomonadales bacterium]
MSSLKAHKQHHRCVFRVTILAFKYISGAMKPALSLAQIYQAIIIAFLAGLPFSFGSLGLTLYYYAIIILLSGLSLTACIRHRQQLLHQGRQYPMSLFLFASWIFFMLAAWLINLDLQHPLQPLLSSYRLLFDLLMIIICVGAACVQVDTKAKPSSWFLALVAGTLCMFVFHSWAFHQLDHSHLNWARNPPLGPNIRDQDKLAGCSAITLLSLLWFKPASTPIRVIYSMALIACVTFLIWASARNSLLALSIMAIAMFAFGFKQLRQQKVLALVPILVTIIAMS